MAFLDTDTFYRDSCEAGYVKLDAVARNIAWTTPTEWGDIEITINLSKPEKDPRAIAAAVSADSSAPATYVDPRTSPVTVRFSMKAPRTFPNSAL